MAMNKQASLPASKLVSNSEQTPSPCKQLICYPSLAALSFFDERLFEFEARSMFVEYKINHWVVGTGVRTEMVLWVPGIPTET